MVAHQNVRTLDHFLCARPASAGVDESISGILKIHLIELKVEGARNVALRSVFDAVMSSRENLYRWVQIKSSLVIPSETPSLLIMMSD